MELIIVELTIIFIISCTLAIVMKLLRLPTILAYIFTGILIGPIALFGSEYFQIETSLEAFSKIGITLLLFILGLEMKISDLKSLGKVVSITGLSQILFTSIFGFFLALIIGYTLLEALYISIALTFSSTIIIVKLLSDKRDINTLYGKISIGFLLIQDFVAIAALLILNGLTKGEGLSLGLLLVTFLKAVLIFSITIFLSQKVLPNFIHKISSNLDVLFAFTLAWAFGISFLISSDLVGLSIEIGGFLAGLALANSVESLQIVSKIRTLRDFFIILFFVYLGASLHLDNIVESIIPALFFSLFVLAVNPLIVLIILTRLGYTSRTGILSGFTVAQISEFSLIIIFLGNSIGHVSNQTASMITLVGIITFSLSSYMIMNGERLYLIIKKHLKVFEKSNHFSEKVEYEHIKNHIVLIGVEQMGTAILDDFGKDSIIAVDFNPEIIMDLRKKGFKTIFGDITESDIMQKANVSEAHTVISTIPRLEDNLILIENIKQNHPSVQIIVNAERAEHKEILEKAGADKVIAPFEIVGHMLNKLLVKDLKPSNKQ